MSKPTGTSGRSTPEMGWTLPIAYWQAQLERARERTAGLRAELAPDDQQVPSALSILRELTYTFEQLSVAEEELRAQTEELERAQTVLDAERRRYHELFQHAPVPYLVTDLAGTIRAANVAAVRLTGAQHDTLLGKPIVAFTHAASRRRLRDVLTNVFAHDVSVAVPLTFVPRGGDPVRVDAVIAMSATPTTRRRARDVELRWLFLDRSRPERRARARRGQAERLRVLVAERTAQLEDAQRIKDQLVATVSHEFRTALSAIGGYAELLEMGLRGGPLNEIQLADVRRIRNTYEHLASIVDDLLNYSKASGRDLPLDVGDVSLDGAVARAVELALPKAIDKRIRIQLPRDSTTDAHIMVRADEERLRQIVLNLIVNAVKFAPADGTVDLAWCADDRAVLLEVRDSGPGIPIEKRDLLFRPYVRLASDTSSPGTGLGLAISRDLARAMGGDLAVDDGTAGGGCFVLRLLRSTGNARLSSISGSSGTG